LDIFVDVRSPYLWRVSYISFTCYVHSDFNTRFIYYYNIHISHDNFRNFDLKSHKIISMCVKVTFALILICSTRLFGHACVKKEKLLYGQLDPLQTLKPVIINVLVSLEFVEFNSIHPSYLCPITYPFPDVTEPKFAYFLAYDSNVIFKPTSTCEGKQDTSSDGAASPLQCNRTHHTHYSNTHRNLKL
jgi:hypothetical protein